MAKRLTIIILAILPMFILTSCDEFTYTVTSKYRYEITDIYSASHTIVYDMEDISDLYADYGMYLGEDFYVRGISHTYNDQEAIDDFTYLIQSVSDYDIDGIGLARGSYFTISLIDSYTNDEIAFYTYEQR